MTVSDEALHRARAAYRESAEEQWEASNSVDEIVAWRAALAALEGEYVWVRKDDLYTEIQDAYCKAYCDGCERPTCGTDNHCCAIYAQKRLDAMLSASNKPEETVRP